MDLVPLDRAPPDLRLKALGEGIVLVQRGIARSDLIKVALEEGYGMHVMLGRAGGSRGSRE